MKYTLDRQEKYNIIKIDEEKLDSTVSPQLKSEFVTIQGQGISNMIIDLSDVKYIDSSGLSALLVGNRLFTENDGICILTCVSDHAMKLIKISQLDKVLQIMPTIEEAVDAVHFLEIESQLRGESDEE
jgi:anti-sigma B factor antagonist